MQRRLIACLVVLLSPVLAQAQPAAPPKLVRDLWDAAYLEGVKMGLCHTTVQEVVQAPNRKLLRTSLSTDLIIKRYMKTVSFRMEVGCEETPEGKVTGLSFKQFLDRGGAVELLGKVEGNELAVRQVSPTGEVTRKEPFSADVIGLAAQERLYQEKKARPGDKFTFKNYELGLFAALTLHATVCEPQEVDVLVPRKNGEKLIVDRVKRSLLRVEVVSDKVEVQGAKIQLPMQVLWLDDNKQIVRSEMELPAMGKLTLLRTTKEVAEQESTNVPLLPDLGLNTIVSLKAALDEPHRARSIRYRVTIKDEKDPGSVFTADARQRVQNVKGNSCELLVEAVREAKPLPDAGPVKPEYLASSHFLDAKDERIKELAAKAVGTETDPWRKAQRIETWVHEHVAGTAEIGFVTASQVARDLRGDCRQHALLMAAMCRAVGVPSRTALGLVYAIDRAKGPAFVFHMWTEVWIKGQWLALDAVAGQGSVGPAHLKIIDHSWQDMQTLAPMLAVTRVLGKLAIEVVEVRR
jgi:hypothetical protein